MITTLRYTNGDPSLIPFEEIQALYPQQIPEGEMIWIDLYRPTAEEEHAVLTEWFGISTLELDDAQRAQASFARGELHFPKLEETESHLFVILRGALIPERKDQEPLTTYIPKILGGQLNLFMNHRVIITHRWADMHIVERVQRMLSLNPKFAQRGPDFAIAQVMDATVDDALEVARLIEERLDQLEGMIMKGNDSEMASRLMKHRRRVFLLRRAVSYQQDIVARLATGGSDFVNNDEALYYRDVADHHVRSVDQLELLRVMVDGLMDLYFSMTSNRLNQVMRVLTVISTVFLPITFITSWYGMNFERMPELGWVYGYPAIITLIALVSIAMLFHAKRRGWFA